MKEFIEKLIGRLEEIYNRNDKAKKKAYEEQDWEYFDLFMHRNEGVYTSISIVNQLAEEYSANTPQKSAGGWIPCSKRMPEEPFGCLVTVMDCEPMTQTDFENILPYHVGYDGETWNDADGNVIPFEVLAWQPLPQPYQPKGE